MIFSDIADIRLRSQKIVDTEFQNAKDLVQYMCAMQAQDFAMAKWAVGLRLKNSTLPQIEESLNKGEILRTHLLRPTWHLVSAEDIFWLLELTSPQIKTLMKSRNNQLELTDSVISKSNEVLRKAFEGDEHLTRDELIGELTRANISTNENRASHLLICAELEKIICSGKPHNNNNQTYALFDKRVLTQKKFHREEAISYLAKKYFKSHYPATLQDFIWWSGLSVKDARWGLENIKSELIFETIDSQIYWLPYSFSPTKISYNSVHLLPAFDEYLISYKNRNACVHPDLKKNAISDNGIFRPIIVVNGQVTGIWKRTQKKHKILIESEFFRKHSKKEIKDLEKISEIYGYFSGKNIEIKHNI